MLKPMPMLATATTSLPLGSWIAEEKLDGHRLLVEVNSLGGVISWSRTGKERELSLRLRNTLKLLPVGIYDGELIVPNGYSSSVSDLSNQHLLQYVVFDILRTREGQDVTSCQWIERRILLESIFEEWEDNAVVTLTPYVEVRDWHDVEAYVEAVWERGGEGAILKDVKAPYRSGKRTKTFLKVKQCQSDVLTIVGFAPSEGEVMDYGAYGTAVLRNEDGVFVPVKVLDDETRDRLQNAYKITPLAETWDTVRLLSGKKVRMLTSHPWVGKKLHIEYQFRTPDGSYRHPRWNYVDGE